MKNPQELKDVLPKEYTQTYRFLVLFGSKRKKEKKETAENLLIVNRKVFGPF